MFMQACSQTSCTSISPQFFAHSASQETLKSVVAQYNASQLLTMREIVSKDILRILTERARFFDIILDDVSITQLTFSKVYEAAVEAKQVAQQEAERAKFVVSTGFHHMKTMLPAWQRVVLRWCRRERGGGMWVWHSVWN